jgi:signal transduction histidine kinase
MSAQRPETILILEDDEGVARLQKRRLERAGYRVALSPDGTGALAHLRAGGFDLLVLDKQLAAEDGLEFYARLKAGGLDLPVVMVTGHSDDATVIRALRAGVRDYIFKSVEYLDYLPEACRRVLDQVRVQREREQAMAELREKTEELKATTQQLWQAARLAGVGELAASIAHELNNPLGTVHLRLESVLAKTGDGDPRRRPLEVVMQEVERMARLVANLLQFSRPGREEVSTVDVCEEIAKTIELTEHHFRKRQIAVRQECAPGVPAIFADRQQLRQVFLNLFTNAADAMSDGGTLTLRVRNDAGAAAVVVEVADTGVGIPAEHLARVLEPFFTTKEEGKGTGLGLAICKRIVQQHNGTLEVESAAGEGTTIRVTLPVRNGANTTGLRGT